MNEYKILINIPLEDKEKYIKDYDIVFEKDNIVFLKMGNVEIDSNVEKEILNYVYCFLIKYKNINSQCLDFTNDMSYILNRINDDVDNITKDKYVSWKIREMIMKILMNKKTI